MLSPSEDTYVEFLALRKVALLPYRNWKDLNAWWSMREAQISDKKNDDESEKTEVVQAAEAEQAEEGMKNAKKSKVLKKGALSTQEPSSKVNKEAAQAALFVQKSQLLLQSLKKVTCKDRDILERGSKAFMAHLRAYKVHHILYTLYIVCQNCFFFFFFLSFFLSFFLNQIPPHIYTYLNVSLLFLFLIGS
jgi:hypothetical protein